MLAETQMQLQNAQHSVLFLQNEHAKVIAGLHDEIRNLQTKCSGLEMFRPRPSSSCGVSNI